MTASNSTWRSEFGISTQPSQSFFPSKEDVNSQGVSVPHAHIVRRAFEVLELDGVLCDDTSPIVYFKLMPRISTAEVVEFHRRFWNLGGAPILVLIAPSEVHIYSGLARPSRQEGDLGGLPAFVTHIARASSMLKEFLPAVESGEFFRKHAKSFNRNDRVDQALLDNLKATREKLAEVGQEKVGIEVLDALLCRLVFTCYLFDRKVIGESYLRNLDLPALPHLRDLLGMRPLSAAKDALYELFAKLARDFNGDLFSDDLRIESALVSTKHIGIVDDFFRATEIHGLQLSFFPYDFSVIPIEAISAIYEQFLNASDKKKGAFYTQRFLAELVLDMALSGHSELLGLRYLDPACGSGIFLVGLFNRMAEEWRRRNPGARNDRRARELMQLLQSSIFGIDVNPTACRITAFSLCLAYLDQLSPRDIQDLQLKGHALPRLVTQLDQGNAPSSEGGIWCGDFFEEGAPYPVRIDLVLGNPPWGSIAAKGSPAAMWCDQRQLLIPDKQIAAAYMWKAAEHAAEGGQVCFVLPHGILFNHSPTAVSFQKSFSNQYLLDRVLNLTDFQRFLFIAAGHPALVLSYRSEKPEADSSVTYWAPKTDWKVTTAGVITISEHDCTDISIQAIHQDLEQQDAPQIWKRMSWATPREHRLLERLSDLPRLRDRVRQAKEKDSNKPWLIAVGFQPVGPNDDPERAAYLDLPSDLFIETKSPNMDLFLLPSDCSVRSTQVRVRSGSNKLTDVFRAPHVLVSKGFSKIAFAEFDVSFQDALRGINGPPSDRKLLIFLAAYMRSPLARFFLFHTSSNWGVARQEIHVTELLRLPFPLPDAMKDERRAKQIIDEVSQVALDARDEMAQAPVDRTELLEEAEAQIDPLIYEYFDILPNEQILVEDTVRVAIPSFRPGSRHRNVPALKISSDNDRARYVSRLCETLNGWAGPGESHVIGSTSASRGLGVGLVVLERTTRGASNSLFHENENLLATLDRLRDVATLNVNTFELARGIKVFDGNRLYLVKPLSRRQWTETAALNDADEIAASILMRSEEEFA